MEFKKSDLNNFEAVIFDLGEVIIDLNPQAVIEGLNQYVKHFESQELRRLIVNSKELYLFETGKISESEFVSHISDIISKDIELEQFREAWAKMLLPIKQQRIDMIENLRETHKVYFLSNTNQTHQDRFDFMIRDSGKYQDLGSMVHTAYYSHKLGLRKPEAEIFEHVISDTGHRPESIVFFDDREENIIAAQKHGIHGVVVHDADHLSRELTKSLDE